MKEKVKEKLEKIVNYIIGKDEKDITIDDFNILNTELSRIEFEENKEEREKNNDEMAKTMAKIFSSR